MSLFGENKWHENLYLFISNVSIILYILALLGISLTNPKYLFILREILKIYISLILIIRFNPYIKIDYTKNNFEFDRKIAFTSGIFLFLTTTINGYFEQLFNEIKRKIDYKY